MFLGTWTASLKPKQKEVSINRFCIITYQLWQIGDFYFFMCTTLGTSGTKYNSKFAEVFQHLMMKQTSLQGKTRQTCVTLKGLILHFLWI